MSAVTSVLRRLGFITGLEGTRFESILVLIHRMPDIQFGKRWNSQARAREFQNRALARKAVNERYARLPVAR